MYAFALHFPMPEHGPGCKHLRQAFRSLNFTRNPPVFHLFTYLFGLGQAYGADACLLRLPGYKRALLRIAPARYAVNPLTGLLNLPEIQWYWLWQIPGRDSSALLSMDVWCRTYDRRLPPARIWHEIPD
jgi:hypothetical protein